MSLVNPSAGSCRRRDSLLGDNLFCPRLREWHNTCPIRSAWRAALAAPFSLPAICVVSNANQRSAPLFCSAHQQSAIPPPQYHQSTQSHFPNVPFHLRALIGCARWRRCVASLVASSRRGPEPAPGLRRTRALTSWRHRASLSWGAGDRRADTRHPPAALALLVPSLLCALFLNTRQLRNV